jgi:hypothetical protein
MKILTICPSINIYKYEKMLETFELTVSKNTAICVQPAFTVTEAINYSFEKNPDYDFYHITNDDVSYLTPLWDMALANKGKISYGNDLLQGENLCTFPMIDGDIVRALGWLQLPTLNRYCGDLVWRTIGKSLKILDYKGSVFIKHHWNEEQVDNDIHKKDMKKFAEWLSISYRDIEKVKAVL